VDELVIPPTRDEHRDVVATAAMHLGRLVSLHVDGGFEKRAHVATATSPRAR
jgi:hypothetical protein